MASAGMKQLQGEKRADFIKRVQAEQAKEAAERAAMFPTKKRRKSRSNATTNNRAADRIDGFDRDDLGESFD